MCQRASREWTSCRSNAGLIRRTRSAPSSSGVTAFSYGASRISACRHPSTTSSSRPVAPRRCAGTRKKAFVFSALSWQPEIAEGKRTAADVDAVFAKMNELLGLAIEVEYCPHAAGPPLCWCRKPLPGLGVLLIHRHHLDPARCLYVGDGPQDAGYAQRLGFLYRPAREFFDD